MRAAYSCRVSTKHNSKLRGFSPRISLADFLGDFRAHFLCTVYITQWQPWRGTGGAAPARGWVNTTRDLGFVGRGLARTLRCSPPGHT